MQDFSSEPSALKAMSILSVTCLIENSMAMAIWSSRGNLKMIPQHKTEYSAEGCQGQTDWARLGQHPPGLAAEADRHADDQAEQHDEADQ